VSHTPGPWTADRVHPEWPECPVRYVDAPGCSDDVCTLYGGESSDENRRRIEADARLIAAAPEMLAALEFVMAHPQAACGMGGGPHAQWEEMRRLAAEAIKKASGDAS
jgi:hypothetical protein